MVYYQSIRIDADSIKKYNEYVSGLKKMRNAQLINELFSYLDLVEESDSGREFHPVQISSVRIQLSGPLNCVLNELRKRRQLESV